MRAKHLFGKPQAVLTLPVSAYHATIATDEDAIYVLTPKAVVRVAAGQEPEEHALDLGIGPALTASAVVFWSQGAVWQAPKRGGAPVRLATVHHQPEYFAARGDHFAWVERSEQDRFSIQTLRHARPQTVYSSPGRIDALAVVSNWAFFVERPGTTGWRIGGAPLAGASPTFTTTRTGRSPSMLAAWQTDIYYYDGRDFEVVRLSPDFHREEAVAEDVVCSPLAVAKRIYCGRVEGIFEIAAPHQPARQLAEVGRSMATSIAANSKLVAWIADTGRDQLTVQVLETRASSSR